MKYFINAQGNYLGGWDGSRPVGAIEVPYPPEDARQPWLGDSWGAVPVVYVEAIAARRYEAEVAGVAIEGVRVNTDDRSKLLINGAALEAVINPGYAMQWKTDIGFVELTGTQVIGIAQAVRAHVQACFDREAELLAALGDGTLTPEMLEQGWP